MSTTVRRLVRKFKRNNQQVRFASKPTVARFHKRDDATMITYDLVADHRYMSKAERIGLVLPILRALKKWEVCDNRTFSKIVQESGRSRHV